MASIPVGSDLTVRGSTGGVIPAGSVVDWAGTSAPGGWLACDGSAVSRSTYAALFSAIGTTWGVGDGSTTFNLPDLRGRATIGSGTGSGLTARTVGTQNIGAETHTLVIGEIPAHTHAITFAATSGLASGANFNLSTSGGATGSAGGGGSHNNMQPSAVVMKIIKT